MKFCQICGRALNDGEVCTCQSQQAAPQQPRYQQPAPQQPYGAQPQYAQPAAPKPAGDGKFVKALKNIPVAFKSYFKGSDRVIGTAKAKKDVLLPLMYVAILCFVNLIADICYFARMSAGSYYEGLGFLSGVFGGPNSKFNFGYVLLAALIMTALLTVLYVGMRFLVQVIFAKKAPAQAIIDAFIEFGFHLIPVCCILLVGGLLSLITSWFMPPFIGLAAAYLIVMYVMDSMKDVQNFPNKFVAVVFLTVSIMVVFGFMVWMMHQMVVMNYKYDMGGLSGGGDYDYEDYLDLLRSYGGF